MRYRAIVGYVVIVALLAVTPQVSQELQALKSAVGNRLRAEIWDTLLSLHAQNGVERAAQPLAAQAATPARAAASEVAGQTARRNKRDGGVRDAAAREMAAASREPRARHEKAAPPAALLLPESREVVGELASERARGVGVVNVEDEDSPALMSVEESLSSDADDAEGAGRVVVRKAVREAVGLAGKAAREKREALLASQFAERGLKVRLLGGEAQPGRLNLIWHLGGEWPGGGKGRGAAPRVKAPEKVGSTPLAPKAPCLEQAVWLPVARALDAAPVILPTDSE